MRVEWDPAKNESNKKKHGIGFEAAKLLWQDENRIEIYAPHPVENRWILIGKINGKTWTAIYTMRGNAIRIISIRRSRNKELELYEKENHG